MSYEYCNYNDMRIVKIVKKLDDGNPNQGMNFLRYSNFYKKFNSLSF